MRLFQLVFLLAICNNRSRMRSFGLYAGLKTPKEPCSVTILLENIPQFSYSGSTETTGFHPPRARRILLWRQLKTALIMRTVKPLSVITTYFPVVIRYVSLTTTGIMILVNSRLLNAVLDWIHKWDALAAQCRTGL